MEDNAKLIETLFIRATEYSKTSYELIKLKTLDIISSVASSLIVHSIIFILIAFFMLFLNLGLAFWLGEILTKSYYGFFVIAAFYLFLGIFMHFFISKKLKRTICNYIITQALK